jgi:hypothetical protein
VRERSNNEVRTYVSTCFEALCTITSVKQKRLVALNEADLIAETLDLLQGDHIKPVSTEIRVAFGLHSMVTHLGGRN